MFEDDVSAVVTVVVTVTVDVCPVIFAVPAEVVPALLTPELVRGIVTKVAPVDDTDTVPPVPFGV